MLLPWIAAPLWERATRVYADDKRYYIRCEHGERAGKPISAEKEQRTEKWHIDS